MTRIVQEAKQSVIGIRVCDSWGAWDISLPLFHKQGSSRSYFLGEGIIVPWMYCIYLKKITNITVMNVNLKSLYQLYTLKNCDKSQRFCKTLQQSIVYIREG